MYDGELNCLDKSIGVNVQSVSTQKQNIEWVHVIQKVLRDRK